MFQLYDTSKPPLTNSPSPLIPSAWEHLLQQYPGDLPVHLLNILRFGAMLGYTGPETLILSPNLPTAALHPEVMDEKIQSDLKRGRVAIASPAFPFISSPLGFVPKPDGSWRKIHHLSFPEGRSVNDFISPEAAYIQYVSFEKVLQMVLAAGPGCTLLKRDMKDAFRIIPVAPHQRWLLGFFWRGTYYTECVLPFGLATAPFIFNLFAEAWHWILQSFLGWEFLEHYLDDSMAAFRAVQATHGDIQRVSSEYKELCHVTGVIPNDQKDEHGTEITLLGRTVNSISRTVSVPKDKLERVLKLTTIALQRGSLNIMEAQSLAGLLSFCAPAVQLGFVFCRRLWTFIAAFRPQWGKEKRRRLPAPVRDDIKWWNELFPLYNGIRFFDDNTRPLIHVFADASELGIGAFFLDHISTASCDWHSEVDNLSLSHILAAPLPERDRGTTFDINIYEILAVLRAVMLWGHKWRGKRVIVHTDNSTTQLGISKGTLQAPLQNEPLREILLQAARLDVVLQAVHLPGKENQLADALSRDNIKEVANWCPHLQTHLKSSSSLHHQHSGLHILPRHR